MFYCIAIIHYILFLQPVQFPIHPLSILSFHLLSTPYSYTKQIPQQWSLTTLFWDEILGLYNYDSPILQHVLKYWLGFFKNPGKFLENQDCLKQDILLLYFYEFPLNTS